MSSPNSSQQETRPRARAASGRSLLSELLEAAAEKDQKNCFGQQGTEETSKPPSPAPPKSLSPTGLEDYAPLVANQDPQPFGPLHADSGLRADTAGLPPRVALLSQSVDLANISELDQALRSFQQVFRGHSYIPLTSFGVFNLITNWRSGNKSIANVTIFRNLIIDKKIWIRQQEDICKLLEYVGAHCQRVLIRGESLQKGTREFDEVWGRAINLLPNVTEALVEE
ncbi:hypothetical protein BU24DRAFT_266753 [Aaosphaeria arxii CBS 175.79]|uniref:Uncharacterized protein n=1 Tax=Aaosphaeria arxii CBS 175.79 TaxID=1450172 RepID=A0A6A5XGH4_9PLEO|nr:uncharacterized protein BU24DRAFT_266753 [Aaosphaeria arxii CBS 175.79]KAF2011937.1 hypothetical protein BU24DRAFT_266753 [Aaosphaeria arxii CBS 175.79]